MSRIFIRACLCAGLFSLAGALSAGPAFDELVRAAGGEDLTIVFDGAEEHADKEDGGAVVNDDSAQAWSMPGRELVFAATSHLSGPVIDKILGEIPVSDDVALVIARAKGVLAATTMGRPLAAFMDKEGVQIKWAPLSGLSYQDYARACSPEDCGGKKIIYLSNLPEHKNLFLDANPAFLTVTLAHELTHLVDFRDTGGGVKADRGPAHFFMELNGRSAETYVYHELLMKGVAPKPAFENKALQMVRLNLAIREYVNGGKKPVLKDFPLLAAMLHPSFDRYLADVTEKPRKGSMSLAGVVGSIYDFPLDSVEDPPKPPAYNYAATKEYEKYLKLRDALGHRTAAYIDWKKANVDAPSSSHPGPDDDDGGGGQHDPGGGSYNPPSLPSGPIDWDGGGL